MITASGLVVRFGRSTVLDDVALTVADGRVTGIVGPNGSGKSTLLRALLGAVRPAAGRVEIDGVHTRRAGRRWIAGRVAFLGQHQHPDPALRVVDEVALGLLGRPRERRRPPAGRDDTVVRALERVGLLDRAGARMSELSGGERQRVAVARVLVQAAPHVLLDEPTNHLDVRHRLELLALLPDLAPTALVVLHDLDLADRVCDDLVLLDRGRVVSHGPPDTVLRADVLDPVYRVSSTVHRTPGWVHLDFRLPTTDPSPRSSPSPTPRPSSPTSARATPTRKASATP